MQSPRSEPPYAQASCRACPFQRLRDRSQVACHASYVTRQGHGIFAAKTPAASALSCRAPPSGDADHHDRVPSSDRDSYRLSQRASQQPAPRSRSRARIRSHARPSAAAFRETISGYQRIRAAAQRAVQGGLLTIVIDRDTNRVAHVPAQEGELDSGSTARLEVAPARSPRWPRSPGRRVVDAHAGPPPRISACGTMSETSTQAATSRSERRGGDR